MKKQTISVQYSTPKYKALEYYLEKQNKRLEDLMQAHLEEITKSRCRKTYRNTFSLSIPMRTRKRNRRPTSRADVSLQS